MKQLQVPVLQRLGFQIGILVALISGLVLGVTGWILAENERDAFTQQLVLSIVGSTQSLSAAAGSPLLTPDPEFILHPLINKLLADNPVIQDLVVLDRDSVIQGHSDLQAIGRTHSLEAKTATYSKGDTRAWVEDDQIVLDQPIVHAGRNVGRLIARADKTEIDQLVRQAVIRTAGIAGSGILVLTLAVLSLLTVRLRPLEVLHRCVRQIGAGDLSTRVTVKSQDELGLLAHLVNDMAAGLEVAQEERVQKERLDRELEIASQLQSMLIPSMMPNVQGFEISAHYSSALEVSGDYYDLIGRRDGSCCVVVADVSGKGIPAMAVMAMARIALRSLAFEGRSPRETLIAANRILSPSIPNGMFLTCIFGVLVPGSDRFHYANAGHCLPVRVDADGNVATPNAGGNAIGMMPPAVFDLNLDEGELLLRPGENLLLYTDGLTEAMSPDSTQLGEEAVYRAMSRRGSAQEAIRRLVALVDGHRGERAASDDLTLVAVRRMPTPTAVVSS